MKRFILFLCLMALAVPVRAQVTTATMGDQNASYVYRLATYSQQVDSTNYGYLTFAQDTGIYYPYLATATTNTTLVAAQTGTTLVFSNGTGVAQNDTKFTLPAATVGMQFSFIADVAKWFRVDVTGSDIINFSTAVAGSSVNNSGSAAAGDSITLFCATAGKWSIKSRVGTWAVDNNP